MNYSSVWSYLCWLVSCEWDIREPAIGFTVVSLPAAISWAGLDKGLIRLDIEGNDFKTKVKENYNYKRKDNKEEVQEEDERKLLN